MVRTRKSKQANATEVSTSTQRDDNRIEMYILQSYPLHFSAPISTEVNWGSPKTPGESPTRKAILRVDPLSSDRDDTLKDALNKFPKARHQGGQEKWNISIDVGANCQNGGSDFILIQDTDSGGPLENLSKQCGGNLKVKVQILNLKYYGTSTYCGHRHETAGIGFDLETIEGKVAYNYYYGTYGCHLSLNRDSFNNERNNWRTNQGIGYEGTGIISVFLPDLVYDDSIKDVLCINRKILKDEVACDVAIVPKNQVAIKCHKNFLCAHSAVLEAMFQSEMKESKTNTVEMPDMTEQSVRAFLDYLYLWDVKEANKSCMITFELLHAGHKYDIKKLEEAMEKILLKKKSSWYDVDVAMKLFLFARNRPEGDKLKLKAIQVLRDNFAELEKSASYQQLFQKDPKAAMELCKYAFSV